jgi:hypothetical protein
MAGNREQNAAASEPEGVVVLSRRDRRGEEEGKERER